MSRQVNAVEEAMWRLQVALDHLRFVVVVDGNQVGVDDATISEDGKTIVVLCTQKMRELTEPEAIDVEYRELSPDELLKDLKKRRGSKSSASQRRKSVRK